MIGDHHDRAAARATLLVTAMDEILGTHNLAQREFARRLASRHALRPHLSADRAADILFCMQSIEVYLKATTECGWTPSQWQRWVTESLVTTILL